jgi:hypothetical protein
METKKKYFLPHFQEKITSTLTEAVSQLEKANTNGAVPHLLANFMAEGVETYAKLGTQQFVDKNALTKKCQTTNDQAEAFTATEMALTTTDIKQIATICRMDKDKLFKEGIILILIRDNLDRKGLTQKWANELAELEKKLVTEGRILEELDEKWEKVEVIVRFLGDKHKEHAKKVGEMSVQNEGDQSEFNKGLQHRLGATLIEGK